MEEVVRIPPEYIGKDMDFAIEEIVRNSFEGKMDKEHGIIVMTKDVSQIGEGKIIHGDGAIYQKVGFSALTFKPELHEIIDGIVCEVVAFGTFCHIGPIDALIHKSQIMDDHIFIDMENSRLVGKETKRSLKIGDELRARIVTASFNEMNPMDSKIGLTMRQPSLGKKEWIEEDRKKKINESL
jgi:DNA-directed RNA polymerase subunit E'